MAAGSAGKAHKYIISLGGDCSYVLGVRAQTQKNRGRWSEVVLVTETVVRH